MEGTIDKACEELLYFQDERRKQDPETAAKIDQFIAKLKLLALVQEPFQFVSVTDGNCCVFKEISFDALKITLRYQR